jgi:uncharacterized membrane protein YccC
VLRHALRAGLVASVAMITARALGLVETHWVVLAAIGILQPYSASTEERALQRVVGTLVGALLAVALATAVSSDLTRLWVIGALTAVSVSLLPLNFGAFQVLLTPDLLLLATLKAGDWSVAQSRAEGVVLACALALAGAWLLWPSPERHRLPDAAAGVLRANGNYLRQVARRRSGLLPEVLHARREVGLALIDAEASFDRMMAEYRGPAQRLEPAMALLSYSRRLAASATALGEERAEPGETKAIEQVADQAGEALDSLAESLTGGHGPPPLPRLMPRAPEADPVSRELLAHVPRQLGVLHGAVEKLARERRRAACAVCPGASTRGSRRAACG